MRTLAARLSCSVALCLLGSGRSDPCSISSPVSPVEMVGRAELIAHVTAARYERPPEGRSRTNGHPESRVLFEVIEVVKGDASVQSLSLPGYLSDRDDFNDRPVPYDFVRRNGRSGMCFANTYREGADHLLILTKGRDGAYRVDWYPLGPVNEQLRSHDDSWLVWVREQVTQEPSPRKGVDPTTG
jgi:hypothetical protein